jgi:methionyl-tRNA synthetase
MNKERILITSALPYANGPLHFGHIAGAYLPADCYARFERLMGNEVLYICGSDEYGVAITLSAELAGRTPQQHVDIFHVMLRDFFQQLEMSFDHYSRTTWPGHVETVHQFFKDLLARGYIEKRTTDQLYSEKDKRFLADRYVVGTCPKCGFAEARGDECQKCGASYEATDLKNPRSKMTGAPLTLKATEHWFLRFDLFKEKLSRWLESKKGWKPSVLHFAKSYIEDLHPRAITRDSDWGIPVPLPEAKGKVLYVWFDAPIGYISATREWAEKTGDKEAWKRFWCDPDTKLVNFIGKDNIPFHAIFFPAQEMGQNEPYKLVDELPANEFLNLEGRQFSKSEGWTIDLTRFFTHFTADQIRYALAANAPETQDAEFTWRDFQSRCNADLVGKYGNLANRLLVFVHQNLGGKIPPSHALDEYDKAFLERIEQLAGQIEEAYRHFHVRKASQLIMELASTGNAYFDAKKPWVLIKDPSSRPTLETALHCLFDCLKVLALTSSPIMPKAAQELWQLIGYTSELAKQNWKEVLLHTPAAGTPLPSPQPLFKKAEDAVIDAEIAALEALKAPKKAEAPPSSEITYEEFSKMELKVAKILAAEPVPKSKKLLRLTMDLGTEQRTIVSGIALEFPDPQVLIGQKVLVIANLKAAKLMGIESHGMLLVAHLEKGEGTEGRSLELIRFLDAEPGAKIS